MQKFIETGFDIFYLSTVIILGFMMISNSKGRREVKLFGIMAIVLGVGDAFHLIPRAWALCTDGLLNHTVSLGIGKFITSITMTVFYLILYHIFLNRYEIKNKILTLSIYLLAIIRIILCFMPQNKWTEVAPPLDWAIYRNIPFAIMGLMMIVLFFIEEKKNKSEDKSFKYMWFAILLSFGFYIPVVLWADIYPMIGMLMIPKTLAYVWIVIMGFNSMKYKDKIEEEKKKSLKL